ncbi:MAG: UDP-2,3-diacylglucosamine diphosphatase [Neisseriaceae bacterium]|nr:UDP-2,3-diacylglucosamine diphosphatase [Neisseriaceae bacterium]
MTIHFLSDLHLGEDTPLLNTEFINRLRAWQGQIEALYLLGDIFEYWIGDDDDAPYLEPIKQALRDFSAETPLFFMHGNRDFLVGKRFAQETRAQLLPDPTPLVYHDKSYLLSHGDSLCTDDETYQKFRQMSRSPEWQANVLAQPLKTRRAMALQARGVSTEHQQMNNSANLGDVNEKAVKTLLQEHGWPTLIHGHTHRPTTHFITTPRGYSLRIVLPDWCDFSKAGYGTLDEKGFKLMDLYPTIDSFIDGNEEDKDSEF